MKNDTISRAAAIDALNKRWGIGTCILGDDIADESAKVLSALPSAQQWIPCTPETMPQEDGEYLVTIHWNNGGYYTDLLRYRAYLKEWKYEDEIFGTVVAWQPKPKPYQEEE